MHTYTHARICTYIHGCWYKCIYKFELGDALSFNCNIFLGRCQQGLTTTTERAAPCPDADRIPSLSAKQLRLNTHTQQAQQNITILSHSRSINQATTWSGAGNDHHIAGNNSLRGSCAAAAGGKARKKSSLGIMGNMKGGAGVRGIIPGRGAQP